jgi:hypothetical protein
MPAPTPPRPISLTDSQMDMVLNACAPLQQVDRPAFLEALAVMLRSSPEIGDGTLGRALRDLQHEFMRGRWPSDVETGLKAPHLLKKLTTAKAAS